jgi:NAD-dependent SIR2 family protein deacetylase
MENYNIRIQNAKNLIKQPDYILIGAGAGLSTAAGLEYVGENFENNYKEFIDKYHFTDLYTATFYNFSTPEEKWAFWAKMIKLNRYNEKPLKLYEELFELVKNKEHFVITTNVDGQFEKAGFEKNKIFAVQGDYSLLQCEEGCHNKVYYNENDVNNWLKNTDKDLKIPSNTVPKCPICGKNMDMNLRKDAYFVQDENWYKQSKMYDEFLDNSKDKKTLLIEIGVGFNTPGIIRFPFEQMVYSNPNTTMIRINKDYPMAREEIKAKSVSFNENTMEIIENLI